MSQEWKYTEGGYAIDFDLDLELHLARVLPVMQKIDGILSRMVSAKLQRLTWCFREEIKKSGSPRRPRQVWRKEPNYSIQNLKGSVNVLKRITMPRIKKLIRMPDKTREPLLTNWLEAEEATNKCEMDFDKIEAFHNGCLRRICRIFWLRAISNFELHAIKNSEQI